MVLTKESQRASHILQSVGEEEDEEKEERKREFRRPFPSLEAPKREGAKREAMYDFSSLLLHGHQDASYYEGCIFLESVYRGLQSSIAPVIDSEPSPLCLPTELLRSVTSDKSGPKMVALPLLHH